MTGQYIIQKAILPSFGMSVKGILIYRQSVVLFVLLLHLQKFPLPRPHRVIELRMWPVSPSKLLVQWKAGRECQRWATLKHMIASHSCICFLILKTTTKTLANGGTGEERKSLRVVQKKSSLHLWCCYFLQGGSFSLAWGRSALHMFLSFVYILPSILLNKGLNQST